jgi:hypothetical protein
MPKLNKKLAGTGEKEDVRKRQVSESSVSIPDPVQSAKRIKRAASVEAQVDPIPADPVQSAKRIKRAASVEAKERIHEQVAAESGPLLNVTALASVSSSSTTAALMYRLSAKSGKSGTITNLSTIPPNLISKTLAGVRDTPSAYTEPPPTRSADGEFHFRSHSDFKPNLSPEEVLRLGSFGGTYFRTIASSVTGKVHVDAHLELPAQWISGLNISKCIASPTYDAKVNKYKVKSGQDLRDWEESGWIVPQDPFGWFQFYCRFFQGRRTDDDDRQISRWCACAGDKGRWKANLAHKVASSGKDVDDPSISPVVRQTLQHWGYKLTAKDLEEGKRKLKAGLGAPYVKGK